MINIITRFPLSMGSYSTFLYLRCFLFYCLFVAFSGIGYVIICAFLGPLRGRYLLTIAFYSRFKGLFTLLFCLVAIATYYYLLAKNYPIYCSTNSSEFTLPTLNTYTRGSSIVSQLPENSLVGSNTIAKARFEMHLKKMAESGAPVDVDKVMALLEEVSKDKKILVQFELPIDPAKAQRQVLASMEVVSENAMEKALAMSNNFNYQIGEGINKGIEKASENSRLALQYLTDKASDKATAAASLAATTYFIKYSFEAYPTLKPYSRISVALTIGAGVGLLSKYLLTYNPSSSLEQQDNLSTSSSSGPQRGVHSNPFIGDLTIPSILEPSTSFTDIWNSIVSLIPLREVPAITYFSVEKFESLFSLLINYNFYINTLGYLAGSTIPLWLMLFIVSVIKKYDTNLTLKFPNLYGKYVKSSTWWNVIINYIYILLLMLLGAILPCVYYLYTHPLPFNADGICNLIVSSVTEKPSSVVVFDYLYAGIGSEYIQVFLGAVLSTVIIIYRTLFVIKQIGLSTVKTLVLIAFTGLFIRYTTENIMLLVKVGFGENKVVTFNILFTTYNNIGILMAYSIITILLSCVLLYIVTIVKKNHDYVDKILPSYLKRFVSFHVLQVIGAFNKLFISLGIFGLAQGVFFLYTHNIPTVLLFSLNTLLL